MSLSRYTPWLIRGINLFSIVAIIFSMVPVTLASDSATVVVYRNTNESGKAAAPRATLDALRSRAPFAVQPKTVDRPLLVGPTMKATKRDSLLVDNDFDTLADPGDVLLYTVVISNTGTDPATGVGYSDTIDANTTLSGTVKSTPLAFNDTYTATGNVAITVTVASAGSNLLSNDVDPDLSGALIVSSAATTSAQGGNVTVAANGDFTYNPPAGYEGVDTFSYTVQDVDGNHDSATVTITISGMIWFINATAGACVSSCNGRLTHPFTSLSAFDTINNGSGNNPAAGDNIFMYESLTDYSAGVTLLNNQKLIGQDSTSSLASLTGLTPPSYSYPLPTMNTGAPTTNLVNASGNGVELASTNSLYGFTAGIASGVAITGTTFGTLTASDMIINNSSSSALVLDTGTANVTFASITSGGGSSNIRLTAVAGTLNLGSGALSNSSATGAAFRINNSGSTATVTYSGTISKTSANSLADIDNHSTGTVTLSGNLTCNSGCTGIDVSNNSSGTVIFSGGTKTLNTGASTAVTLGSNTGATINFTGGGLDIDTTSGAGITATVGGTINVTGSGNTINTTTGQAVVMNSVTVGPSNITFATISVSGSPTSLDALSFTSVGGSGNTFSGGNVTVAGTTTSGDGIDINGSAATFTFISATIDSTAGAGINLSGSNGAVTFTTVDIDGTLGAGINVMTNTNAVNVNAGSLGATNDPGGNVVDVSAGNANVTIAAALTKSTAGRIVEITGRTGTATIDITNSLNCSSTCTGINVQNNNTSGTTTINFSNGTKNLSTGTNAAITLDNNDNATINFSNGGLNIDTTSGTGFNAINGALSVNVTTGANPNTIDATTGTALNVTSTTIGSSGLTFQKITSNGSGTANGIILDTTGSNSALTVTGNGGSCTSAATCTGGTISNKTGANGSTTQGTGIYLNSTSGVSLDRMQLNDFDNFAIRGTTVTGFSLTNSNINGANGNNNAGGSEEGSLRFDNLFTSGSFPTAQITDSTISGGGTFNVYVRNTTTASTLNRLVMTNNTFGLISATIGNDNVDVTALPSGTNTATVNVTLQDNFFLGTRGDFFETIADGNSTMDVIARRNKFTNGQTIIPGGGVGLSIRGDVTGTADNVTFDLSCNNVVGGHSATGIFVAKGNGGGTWSGAIVNNIVGPASGAGGDEIFIRSAGSGTISLLVRDNNLSGYGNVGLHLQNNDGSSTMNASIFNNITSAPHVNGFAGLFVDNGATATDTSTANVVVGSASIAANKNDFSAGDPANFSDVSLSNFNASTTFNLYKNGSGSGTAAGVIDDDNLNPATTNTDTSGGAGAITLVTSGLPTVPATPAACTTVAMAPNNNRHLVQNQEPRTSIAQAARTSTVESSSVKLFKPTELDNLDNAAFNTYAEALTNLPTTNLPARSLYKPMDKPANSPLFSGEIISFTIGTLPASKVITLTFAVTITNPITNGATSISNQGIVAGSNFSSILTDDPDTGALNDPTVTPLDIKADLALTKSDGGISAQPGDIITYTLNYTNTGPNLATGVTLTETVPTNTTYTNTGAGWSCGGSTCTKNVGSLALNASGSITFTVTLTNPVAAGLTLITNTATIGSGIPDPVSGNNTAVDTTPVDAEPDFQLSKTDGGVSATPLGIITYTLTYTNTGNQGATGVVITETVPAHTTYTGSLIEWNCPSGPGPGQPCAKTIGALAGGGVTGTLLFTVTVVAGGEPPIPAGVDTLTNTAIITDDVTNGVDLTPGNNTAVDTTPLNAQPDFTLNKNDGGVTAVPGDVVTYTLSYANLGNQSATGVVLTETVPANTTFAGSGWTGCTSGSPGGTVCTKSIGSLLGSGLGSGTAVFVITVTNPITAGVISITNTAQIGDDGSNGADPTPASNTATDFTPITAAPDLQIVKSDGGSHGTPGSVVQYTLTYTNTGNQGATGIVISDTVPTNTTFYAGSSNPNWVCSPDNDPGSTCVITLTSSLAGGNATGVITFALEVDSPFPLSEPSITNTASITDDGTNGIDVTPSNNTSTDVTPIDNLPNLKLTKSDGDISVLPGGVITYTLTYKNLGGLTAPNAILSDTVPANTTFKASASTPGWSCSNGAPAGTVCLFTVGDVLGQATGSVDFAVTVVNPIPTGVDKIYNSAVITDDGSNGEDPDPGNNWAMDYTPVDAAPDLQITKSDGGVSKTPGSVITYTLTYTNTGSQGATGVVLTETVPANTTYADGGWICTPNGNAGSICTLSVGTLAINGSGTATFVVTVTNPVGAGVNAITNTVTIGDDGDNGADENNGDNQASDTTPITAAPNLQVTKTDGGITAVPGDTITYTVTFANTGNQGATGVVLTETVPANTTYTGGTWTCTPNNNASSTCTFSIGDLDAGFGGSEVFVVTTAISVPAGVNIITNTVKIGDDGTNGVDPNTGDNTGTDTTPLNAAPDLQIIKSDGGITATAGSPITYTLTYTNTGNQDATGVVITETVPTNTTATSGSGWTCASGTCTLSVGALAADAGGSTTFTVTVASSVPAGVTAITNTVTIGDNGTNGADPNTGDNTAVVVTPLNAAPDLKVTKTDGGISTTTGSVLTYTVTYTNTGTQGATGVVLTETVPANTTFSGAGWSCNPDNNAGSICTRNIGGLAAGVSGSTPFVLTVASSVPNGVTTITNTVTIADDGANGADLNTGDNTGTDTTPLIAAPDLRITKDDNGLNATPGSFISYNLIYTNTGSQTAVGVVITDIVPANTTFSSASTPGWSCANGAPAGSVCTFNAGNLNVSSASAVTFVLQVNLSTPAGVTAITNTATIGDNGSEGPDLNPANNSDSESTPLLRPDLSLTKDDNGATAAAGAVINYTLTYSNIGTWQSNGVVLTDTVPANTTFNLGASSAGWSCANGAPAGSVCTLNIGTVLTSTGGTRTFAVTVNSPLPSGVTTITNTATIGDNGTYGLDNNPANNTATEVTGGLRKIFLPLVLFNYAEGPDLVVTQLLTGTNAITVTIKNVGTEATAASFWVDVYINPSAAPTHVNQTWSSLGTRGAAWGVTASIAPNGVLTLTLGGPYYSPANSNIGGPLTNASVYAQVDSVNMSTTYGAVLENHEIAGGAYNNIAPPLSVLSLGAQTATATTSLAATSSTSGLAPLPPRNSNDVNRRRPE